MFSMSSTSRNLLAAFKMAPASIRYSQFVPRVYNLAKSLGFEPGKIMPSRAFCSDESQGYPIILIAKHFGAFPFNHGMVGGVVATDRHGPHASHGKDMVFIQASHVGYDTEKKRFGVYRRLQTVDHNETPSCGKICGALDWYLREYAFARNNILLRINNNRHEIIIDNQLLHSERQEGLILHIEKLVEMNADGNPAVLDCLSTSKIFSVAPNLAEALNNYQWQSGEGEPIHSNLSPECFFFRKEISHHDEGRDHLEKNLLDVMPHIVTSKWPALTAAQANTQVEFDRTFRTITQEPAYQGKKVLFISGLHVDISPSKGQLFPLTKFIPWAAYIQDSDGSHCTWEQDELYEKLKAQSTRNPDQVDLESAINAMESVEEILLPF